MIVRRGNNIILEFSGITEILNILEFNFVIQKDNILLFRNDELLFKLNRSEVKQSDQELTELTLVKDGLNGEKGDQGLKGEKGNIGNTGETGENGKDGINGEQGDQGTKGDTGKQGLQGNTGIQGIKGLNGDKGTKGKDGLKGIKGIQGKKGLNGLNGENGKQGIKGNTGDIGKIGTKGNNGTGFDFKGEYEAITYNLNDIVRWQGILFIALKDVPETKPPTTGTKLNEDFWGLWLMKAKDGQGGGAGKLSTFGLVKQEEAYAFAVTMGC